MLITEDGESVTLFAQWLNTDFFFKIVSDAFACLCHIWISWLLFYID